MLGNSASGRCFQQQNNNPLAHLRLRTSQRWRFDIVLQSTALNLPFLLLTRFPESHHPLLPFRSAVLNCFQAVPTIVRLDGRCYQWDFMLPGRAVTTVIGASILDDSLIVVIPPTAFAHSIRKHVKTTTLTTGNHAKLFFCELEQGMDGDTF